MFIFWFILIFEQHYVSATGGCDIETVLQALEPAFQTKLSLHFPLDNISLLKGSQDLAAVFSDEQLVRELFPHDLFMVGLDLYEPKVENIPEIMALNRHYALASDRKSFSAMQFSYVTLGLGLRLKVVGQHLTSAADVMAHIITYLPLITRYYKRGKVAFGVSVPEKNLADQVQEQMKILPFHDDKFPLVKECVLEVRYAPLDEL